jgi:hypothetical protein
MTRPRRGVVAAGARHLILPLGAPFDVAPVERLLTAAKTGG